MGQIIKMSTLVFITISVILFFIPKNQLPEFYDLKYMEICLLFGISFVSILEYFIKKITKKENSSEKKQALRLLQILVIITIGSNILGDLGLYQLYKFGFQFDKLIHFTTPLAAMIIFPIVFNILFGIEWKKSLILSLFIILTLGIFWEISEYLTDLFLKTHIFGVYGNEITRDTKFDLLFDVLGSAVGLFLQIFKNKK